MEPESSVEYSRVTVTSLQFIQWNPMHVYYSPIRLDLQVPSIQDFRLS
jgi:hypothetical protein